MRYRPHALPQTASQEQMSSFRIRRLSPPSSYPSDQDSFRGETDQHVLRHHAPHFQKNPFHARRPSHWQCSDTHSLQLARSIGLPSFVLQFFYPLTLTSTSRHSTLFCRISIYLRILN